jgi:hypothetical protein
VIWRWWCGALQATKERSFVAFDWCQALRSGAKDYTVLDSGPAWEVDLPLNTWEGKAQNFLLDSCLRPIRDQDGEDEILRIAGKPQEVTA